MKRDILIKKLIAIFIVIFLVILAIGIKNLKNNVQSNVNNTKVVNSKKTLRLKKTKVIKENVKKIPALLLVVNKKHPLTENYNPYNGYVNGSNPSGSGLNPETQNEKNRMIEDMQNDNLPVSKNISGYRSYTYQKFLYNKYALKSGIKNADTYSARPGYSDHQTGLAFDLIQSNGKLLTNYRMYNWLKKNAYKYGFIIRFPENETKITGYIQEDWHMRYIGEKYAKQMHDQHIDTLEEFTGISGGNYNSNLKDNIAALSELK